MSFMKYNAYIHILSLLQKVHLLALYHSNSRLYIKYRLYQTLREDEKAIFSKATFDHVCVSVLILSFMIILCGLNSGSKKRATKARDNNHQHF